MGNRLNRIAGGACPSNNGGGGGGSCQWSPISFEASDLRRRLRAFERLSLCFRLTL